MSNWIIRIYQWIKKVDLKVDLVSGINSVILYHKQFYVRVFLPDCFLHPIPTLTSATLSIIRLSLLESGCIKKRWKNLFDRIKGSFFVELRNMCTINRSHLTTAIWWPLGVAVVSVTCMRVRWVSHTWKYTQWNIFLFESSDKRPYWTNPYHIGFRYVGSFNFHSYFGQCPNDIYILLHIPLSCLSKLPAQGTNDCHGP